MRPNLQTILSNRVVFALVIIFWLIVLSLFWMTINIYPGDGVAYTLFTFISSLFLYFGFRKNAIFFDTFMGIFLWLGLWLKFSVTTVFSNGVFHAAVGHFDGSAVAFDRALMVSVCGICGFILASYIREKLSFNYPERIKFVPNKGLFLFYVNNRKAIWFGFILLFTLVGMTNIYFGIYQRGTITKTILPFGLNGVYTWLLLFGFATISAIIIRFELEIDKKTSLLAITLAFLESLISNVSLLSRGMLLNSLSLMYGVLASIKSYSIKSNLKFFLFSGSIFIIFFIASVLVVNSIRAVSYDFIALIEQEQEQMHSKSSTDRDLKLLLQTTKNMTFPLFIDRWVGMEGVMAVSSYPRLGWDLWDEAVSESFNPNDTSFFDNKIIISPYVDTDKSKHHFISLPGIIAFLFYPGSFYFLFICSFLLGIFAAGIEWFVFRFGGKNLILTSLISQVVAFRFASFGYVPQQSYLLFGSIFLTILIIFFADKFFSFLQRRS